jgi:hypothetical protein
MYSLPVLSLKNCSESKQLVPSESRRASCETEDTSSSFNGTLVCAAMHKTRLEPGITTRLARLTCRPGTMPLEPSMNCWTTVESSAGREGSCLAGRLSDSSAGKTVAVIRE